MATTDPGSDCSAFVTIPQPLVVGTCDLGTLTNDYNGTSDASDEYPLGTTTVTYTITDLSGLVVTCTVCLLYTSPSPRDQRGSRMPSSA